MLKEFGQGIWIVDGPPVTGAAGFHFPTRMVVMRLSEGVVIWSPVALTQELQEAVQALGPVLWIVAPSKLHDLFVAEWQNAFPTAQCLVAPGLREARPDLRVDGVLGSGSPEGWREELDHVIFPNRIADEAILFHRASGTLVICDLLQQMPAGWYSGWRALVARADLMTGSEPQVPRKFRLATRRRDEARRVIGAITTWPVSAIVMAHGTPVIKDAGDHLRRAFRWLMGQASGQQ